MSAFLAGVFCNIPASDRATLSLLPACSGGLHFSETLLAKLSLGKLSRGEKRIVERFLFAI
jgi:hypothetical protein